MVLMSVIYLAFGLKLNMDVLFAVTCIVFGDIDTFPFCLLSFIFTKLELNLAWFLF